MQGFSDTDVRAASASHCTNTYTRRFNFASTVYHRHRLMTRRY